MDWLTESDDDDDDEESIPDKDGDEEATETENVHQEEAVKDGDDEDSDDVGDDVEAQKHMLLKGVGSLRHEKKVTAADDAKITRGKQNLFEGLEAKSPGQHLYEDVMRVVCTTYYDGGDKQEDVYCVIREEKTAAIPKAILVTCRGFKLNVKAEEVDMLIKTYPKENPTQLIHRVVKQKGGDVYEGSKPLVTGNKIMIEASKLDTKYKFNYVAARKFFTIMEMKEQLSHITGVKVEDQIMTYRDHVLEVCRPNIMINTFFYCCRPNTTPDPCQIFQDSWLMEMIVSGDRVASLAMYENPKVVAILKVLHQTSQHIHLP